MERLTPMTSELKRPYLIYRPPPGWGFWSNFICMIQGIDYADQHDLVPVVDMERYRTRYSEDDERVLGTKNAWEYYFAQPGGLTVAEALRLDPLNNQGSEKGPLIYVDAIQPPSHVFNRVRELLNRYIRVRPEILAEVESILGADTRPDILGVHVRGTDMRWGNIPGHPVSAPTIVYLEQATALDRKYSFSRIFLACDEVETVILFRERFGDRLLTVEAHRTAATIAISGDYQWLFEPRRELHCYQLGREVLMDALLLARCGHLLCGISNVSHAAMYFSDKLQDVHPVPPLWHLPHLHEASRGRSYVMADLKLTAPLSVDALMAQSEGLQILLENAENVNAETAREARELQEKVAILTRKSSAENSELKAARKEVLALQKSLDHAHSQIGRFKHRILQLVNGWAWLGWRLMPWTKPSWRKNPLDD